MPETLALIDGHALLHRAFHALAPLSTSKGEPTNATFGFLRMLLKVLTELRPDYAAVAFDTPAPTFRHQEFPDYKAQRPPTPDALGPQLERVRQLLEAFRIPIFGVEGYEGDDILGTLAEQARQKGVECLIVTGDADALQLVGPGVRVLVPHKGLSETILYDEAAVKARYGVSPPQLTDFKALVGDPSDNIPGLAGVGPSTAAKLLQEFGSLDEVYASLDRLPDKVRAAFEKHAAEVRRSKHLVTIVRSVPVRLDWDACRLGGYDRDRVMGLLRELEFRSLVSKLPPLGPPPAPATPRQGELFAPEGLPPAPSQVQPAAPPLGHYRLVDSPQALEALAAELAQAPRLAVDTETDSLDPLRADLVGLALSPYPGQAYYIPIGHRTPARQLSLALVQHKLGPLLSDGRRPKVGHNAKFDLLVLWRHGFAVEGLAFDTLVAAHLLERNPRASLNLKDLAWAKLGLEMTPITDLIGSGKRQLSMAQVPAETVAAYAGADADAAHRLAVLLEKELRQAGLWDLFAQIEMPLVPVLARMEEAGVALDEAFLKQMSRELHHKIGDLTEAIYQAVGHHFNINSTQQLGAILFGELKLPGGRRTKTGYSTDAAVLEELRGAHPVVDLLLEYRQLVKLKSTYVDALPVLVNPRTGRLHTSFNQTGTATGRISSSEPNIQNIPIRTEMGRRIRRAFVAGPPDCWLLSADYSQIEPRILAHFSGDERLLAAFAAGEDIHAATASEVFGLPPTQVTPEMRRIAKTINFSITYGVTDYGLSVYTGLSREEAGEYIKKYLAQYEGVRGYMEATKQEAREKGYVSTLLGRRRYIPDINASHQVVRAQAERMAINAPIQGSAADIIKLAMIGLDAALRQRKLQSRMLLQVHDELLLEVPERELAEIKALVQREMEHAYPLSVPLKVEVKVGRNWEEMA